MKRKEFLKKVAVGSALIVPSVVIIQSCGEDGEDDPNPNNNTPPPLEPLDCLANGTFVNIGTNHGHSLSVSKSAVKAGIEKTYSIKGSSAHNHTVTITESHFKQLAEGTSVVVTSTSDNSHTHAVTVSCQR